jgi:hypothetical protein
MHNDNLKNEFASYCYGLSKVNDKWYFFWELLEKEGEKYILFKNKMLNLLNMLNENDTNLLDMDIENEIWYII